MKETRNLDCRPPNLSVFALSASIELYQTVDHYEYLSRSAREISQELRGLIEVLGPLNDIVGAEAADDMKYALSQCGTCCNEFRKEIREHLPYPDDGSVRARNWTSLTYLHGDIDKFRHLLTGYKSTFDVALASTNL